MNTDDFDIKVESSGVGEIPQFAKPDGNTLFLGRFKEYDLYIGFQKLLPKTLIAKYGSEAWQYTTFNPTLCGLTGPSFDAVFQEAYRRANCYTHMMERTKFPSEL